MQRLSGASSLGGGGEAGSDLTIFTIIFHCIYRILPNLALARLTKNDQSNVLQPSTVLTDLERADKKIGDEGAVQSESFRVLHLSVIKPKPFSPSPRRRTAPASCQGAGGSMRRGVHQRVASAAPIDGAEGDAGNFSQDLSGPVDCSENRAALTTAIEAAKVEVPLARQRLVEARVQFHSRKANSITREMC